jgi:hypothetical protein
LLGYGLVSTFPWQRINTIQQNKRGTLRLDELYSVRPEGIKELVQWAAIVNASEENRASYCKVFHGKPPFTALYCTYTVTLLEFKAVLKARTLAGQTNLPKTTEQQITQEKCSQEVRRRKGRATDENTGTSLYAAVQTETSPSLNIPPKEVVTRKFFALLRTADMDTDASGTEATSNEEAVPGKRGRPPPIILTLEKQLKSVVKQTFEFRSTINGNSHHERYGGFVICQIPLRRQ